MIIRRASPTTPLESRRPTTGELFDALDFARKEMMFRGSPDFLRQQVGEDRVQRLIARLLSPSSRGK
jgi:hypothetical protein